jgi:hypothetical protein
MAGLVPAIHVFGLTKAEKTWMPATSAGMTKACKDGSPNPGLNEVNPGIAFGAERADRRSIKNCESLHALLLRHFSESFLAMKHVRSKIEECSPTNAGFAASA